jgi:hypothetical protein
MDFMGGIVYTIIIKYTLALPSENDACEFAVTSYH